MVPLLLFNTVGYYLVFYGDLIAVKHEAEVMIWGHKNTEQVVSIRFALKDNKPVGSDLIFTDDDEFIYQGRMYDVIRSSRSAEYIEFKCYTDTKETTLAQNLCKKVDSDTESPAQKNKGNSSVKEFVKDYTPHEQEVFTAVQTLTSSCFYMQRTQLQPLIYKAIVSPPPELVVG
jgi:hypothetical protein